MVQKEKQLLLKDISSRLPYLVKGLYQWKGNVPFDRELDGMLYDELYLSLYSTEDSSFKPYLRPMSSMTSDERIELSIILSCEFYVDDDFALVAEDDRHRIRLELCEGCIDWLLTHHFDYRGLIEKGLALEAPEVMYKID